jgi:hypothetical protein
MIAEITNKDTIKQGLFPAPGTKNAPSNKTGKTEYHWDLCMALFSDHNNYKAVLPRWWQIRIAKKVGY